MWAKPRNPPATPLSSFWGKWSLVERSARPCEGAPGGRPSRPPGLPTFPGTSWVVISGVISRVTIHIRRLTLLITTHEPPSRPSQPLVPLTGWLLGLCRNPSGRLSLLGLCRKVRDARPAGRWWGLCRNLISAEREVLICAMDK